MSDLISRQELFEELNCINLPVGNETVDKIFSVIENIPSAQPEPCEDAVSRAEAIKCITYDEEYMEECLRQLPSVTPKQSNYKTDHGYMWICPDCGLVVHSDFKKCVRCGHKREDERSRSE